MGIRAFMRVTKYWTVSERNTQYVTLAGDLLWNRLLWFAVGMVILGIACRRFSFTDRSFQRKASLPQTDEDCVLRHPSLPPVLSAYGWASRCRQFISQFRVDFWGIVRSHIFIVVMLAGLLNTTASLILSANEGFGVGSLPVTYEMIDIIRGTMYVFLLAVMVFYAGALVWKERDANLDEVYDALPHPTWMVFLAKLAALTVVIMLVLAVGMLAGMALQAFKGYTRFQVGLYVRELFVIDLTQLFCLLVLAMLSHVMSANKYIGYFAFIILVILNTFAWNLLHVETEMVRYGSLPSHTYSDMFGFAPFVSGLTWFGVYWLLFAGLLSLAAIAWWQRGRETAYRRTLEVGPRTMAGHVVRGEPDGPGRMGGIGMLGVLQHASAQRIQVVPSKDRLTGRLREEVQDGRGHSPAADRQRSLRH